MSMCDYNYELQVQSNCNINIEYEYNDCLHSHSVGRRSKAFGIEPYPAAWHF